MATLQAAGSQGKHDTGHVATLFENRQINNVGERWGGDSLLMLLQNRKKEEKYQFILQNYEIALPPS